MMGFASLWHGVWKQWTTDNRDARCSHAQIIKSNRITLWHMQYMRISGRAYWFNPEGTVLFRLALGPVWIKPDWWSQLDRSISVQVAFTLGDWSSQIDLAWSRWLYIVHPRWVNHSLEIPVLSVLSCLSVLSVKFLYCLQCMAFIV